MLKVSHSHRSLKTISSLPLDLTEGMLSEFDWAPEPLSKDSLIKAARQRADVPVDRKLLVSVLEEQYEGSKLSKSVKHNLKVLSDDSSRTITTGHQLNTFTGPLYFIYKILHVCRLAEEMNSAVTDYHWVPVYWMATEDHDFDEINHAWISGEKYQWSSDQQGAVGRFDCTAVGVLIDELQKRFSDFPGFSSIANNFEAYRHAPNLAAATRAIVNDLFADYGLIIIDADDARLKKALIPVLQQDVEDSFIEKEVEKTVASWNDDYKVQVTPRDINFFYLRNGYRERITLENGSLETADGLYSWSSDKELIAELNEFPDRCSPNVLTRPMYQELILPNVAYVGGGAEVSYWLELKSAFAAAGVFFPLVQLRTSVTVFSTKSVRRLNELGLEFKDVYGDMHSIERKVVEEDIPSLVEDREAFARVLSDMRDKVVGVNPGLSRSMDSLFQDTINRLERLEKKVVRETKKNHETQLNRLHAVVDEIYPQGILQERRMNVIDLMMMYGPAVIHDLFEMIDPFEEDQMTIITI